MGTYCPSCVSAAGNSILAEYHRHTVGGRRHSTSSQPAHSCLPRHPLLQGRDDCSDLQGVPGNEPACHMLHVTAYREPGVIFCKYIYQIHFPAHLQILALRAVISAQTCYLYSVLTEDPDFAKWDLFSLHPDEELALDGLIVSRSEISMTKYPFL